MTHDILLTLFDIFFAIFTIGLILVGISVALAFAYVVWKNDMKGRE